jgi:hypothetical protein
MAIIVSVGPERMRRARLLQSLCGKGPPLAQRIPGATADKYADHWRALSLMPGAPACVIKAAHRYFIEIHHPDRGGSVTDAQRVNVAFDELKELGSKPNEHVAAFYEGEPWHVLGVSSSADKVLAERAGKALALELASFDRLAARVRWAVQHFGQPGSATSQPRPRMPAPPPPSRVPRREAPATRPAAPAAPGKPMGLPTSIEFGDLAWNTETTRELRLTWENNAPYNISVTTSAPVTATVATSKAKPGRFVIAVGIDWRSAELREHASMRGYMLHAGVVIRWPGGEATIPARGTIHYPAEIAVSPIEIDLGTVVMRQPVRTDIVLIATGAALAEVTASAWLARVDSAGNVIDGPLRLKANTPVRVPMQVQWAPIVDRAASVEKGKPVRPTGKITVRWGERSIEVAVVMVATRDGRR